MLLDAVSAHRAGLDKFFVFVQVDQANMRRLLEELGFSPTRYSFLLVREKADVPEYTLPEGFYIREFVPGKDEEAWCQVRNAAFARLQGSETPITPAMAAKMPFEAGHIDGGLMILFHGERPVGIVRGEADQYEGEPAMNIGPLAVIPEYQGRGLGRSLLRASLKLAAERSYNRTVLCVNADNEKAKSLYLQEGFKQVEAVACYEFEFDGEEAPAS